MKLLDEKFQDGLQHIYDNHGSDSDMDVWRHKLVEWYLLEIRAVGHNLQKEERKKELVDSWMRFIDEFYNKYK